MLQLHFFLELRHTASSYVSPAPLHKPEEEKMIEAPTFVDEGFLAESYRALYSDVMYGLKPPIPSLLGKDLSLLPPAEVTGKAGRLNKGPRKRARIRSNGEFNSSSRFSQSLENLSGTASEAAGVAESGPSQSAPVDVS